MFALPEKVLMARCMAQLFALHSLGALKQSCRASGGTGLAGWFLWLSDDHNLGKRNHLKPWGKPNADGFHRLCGEITKLMPSRFSLEKLVPLGLPVLIGGSVEGGEAGHRAGSGRWMAVRNDAVRGAAGKFDLQVLKVSAIMHVARYSRGKELVPANVGAADLDCFKAVS